MANEQCKESNLKIVVPLCMTIGLGYAGVII